MIQLSSCFNFLKDLPDLVIDQCHLARVTRPEFFRILNLTAWRLSESPVQLTRWAAVSLRRPCERLGHVIRAVHARVRLRGVPRFMWSCKTDPAEPRRGAFVILKVVPGLLTDVNVVVFG